MDEPVICILKYENHLDSQVFSYDSDYSHDEARISADERTIMFFTYKQFRIYDFDNELICEVDIPNASDVYDQQFVRDGNSSYLEVTYYDGTIERYNARDGTKIYSEKEIYRIQHCMKNSIQTIIELSRRFTVHLKFIKRQ